MSPIRRRRLLGWVAAGTALHIAAPCTHSSPWPDARTGHPAGWLRHRAAAKALGRRCRAIVMGPAAGLEPVSAVEAFAAGPRARVLAAVRDDFARGQLVMVDGWLLAWSEAWFFAGLVELA